MNRDEMAHKMFDRDADDLLQHQKELVLEALVAGVEPTEEDDTVEDAGQILRQTQVEVTAF
jgi:hypothetical protein